jgi:APA family basic amino acid/polyamine antiporter
MDTSNGTLNRTLSLPVVTLYGLGTIIGAGIYVLIGEVVAEAGALTPLAFLLAALIASFSAFSYAELSSRFPLSAGEAVYVERAFGIRLYSVVIGLMMVFVGIIASATLAKGFAGHLEYIIPADETLSLTLLIFALGGLAAWGIAQSAWVAIVSTLIEIAGLLLILWVTRDNLADAPAMLQESIASFPGNGWQMLTSGAFIAFFAFLGFEDIVNVAEEVREPSRNLPRAVILSLLVSALLYIAIALAAVTTVPIGELAGSSAPLALVYEQAAGKSPLFILSVSIAAIVNGTLIMMIMASRILYGMSRQQWLPGKLSAVNAKTRTPLLTTLLITLLILGFSLWLPVATLAITTTLVTLLVFFSVNLSALVIKLRERRTGREETEAVSYPVWIAAAGAVSSCGFILLQISIWLE